MESVFRERFMTELSTPCSFWRDRALICLAVVLSYASVWPNKFLFDDIVLIKENSFLKTSRGLVQIFTHRIGAGAGLPILFYRPVPMAVHWCIYHLSTILHIQMTVGFHALNIALQALNGCLLLAFGLRAGFNRYAALAAALLWAVHPLHTEAVAYMAATPELLWSTFCLLGLITLLPKKPPVDGIVDPKEAFTPRRITLSLVLFTLALLSKESAIVFPALAAATLFFISNERARLPTYFKTWPLWYLSFAYTMFILFIILGNITTTTGPLNPAYAHIYKSSIAVRIWTALATLPTYAHLIVWPEELYFRREAPVFTTLWHWQPLLGLAMVLAAAAQILWGRGKRGLALTFGLLWFAAAQSPNTGIVAPIDALISEHWMYLPTMGLFLGVTQTFSGLFRHQRKAAILLVTVMTVALGTATFRQNMKWFNIDTVYRNTRQYHARASIMSNYEGMFLISRRRFAAARQTWLYCLDNLPADDAYNRAMAHTGLAMVWLHAVPEDGDTFTGNDVRRALPLAGRANAEKAVTELQKAARFDTARSYKVHQYLSVIYTYLGEKNRAAEQKKIAAQLKIKDL